MTDKEVLTNKLAKMRPAGLRIKVIGDSYNVPPHWSEAQYQEKAESIFDSLSRCGLKTVMINGKSVNADKAEILKAMRGE